MEGSVQKINSSSPVANALVFNDEASILCQKAQAVLNLAVDAIENGHSEDSIFALNCVQDQLILLNISIHKT